MLDGQVAVVTGASRGVGRVLAASLAAEGARVVVVARSADDLRVLVEEITAAGGSAVAKAVDVTSEEAVLALVAVVDEEVGPIDLLVNNAGGNRAVGPLWETTMDEWWGDIELNLKSAVMLARAVVPGMLARGAGRIVNLGSILGTAPAPFTSAYSTAKVGLILFTESLEQSLAGTGVHAFVMSPGLVRTPGFEQAMLTDRGRRWLPEFSNLDPAVMVGPELAAGLLVRIADGSCDELAGRFLHVRHDVDELRAAAGSIAADERFVMRLRD